MRQKGRPLTPLAVLDAINKYGESIGGKIGKRPVFSQLLKGLGLWKGLRIVGEPGPGRSATLEVELPPSTLYLVAASWGDEFAINNGFEFLELLNPANMMIIYLGIKTATAKDSFNISVPKVPSLTNSKFIFQLFYLTENMQAQNSNAAVLWVR